MLGELFLTFSKVRDFFEFCGTIEDLEMQAVPSADGKRQEALVLFANPMAAKTAILLTNAQLEDQPIQVSYYFTENSGEQSARPANAHEIQVKSDDGCYRDRISYIRPTAWLVSGSPRACSLQRS
jgi:hypothetical protein